MVQQPRIKHGYPLVVDLHSRKQSVIPRLASLQRNTSVPLLQIFLYSSLLLLQQTIRNYYLFSIDWSIQNSCRPFHNGAVVI